MSDNWIILVPDDPYFVPTPEMSDLAYTLFEDSMPEADEVEIKESAWVQFFDCGANLERIVCPGCGGEIDSDWWSERMDEDFGGHGFNLDLYTLPCCGSVVSLDRLIYDLPQAFARFGMEAMNPDAIEMPENALRALEGILGVSLKVIYCHI